EIAQLLTGIAWQPVLSDIQFCFHDAPLVTFGMVDLNLPSFEYRIKKTEEKTFIFDEIRKKFVVLTPEEWVRQHFVHYMIGHLRYPRALINVETGLAYNQLRKRSDIVLYDRTGKPWMIVECKAPH